VKRSIFPLFSEKAISMFGNGRLRRIAVITSIRANFFSLAFIVLKHLFNVEFFNKYSVITNIAINDVFSKNNSLKFYLKMLKAVAGPPGIEPGTPGFLLLGFV
jgi:hypothetical protein